MSKLTRINANACDIFRAEFDAAMKQIEEKLGIKICLGKLTYSPESVSGKMVFNIEKNINLYKLTDKEWIGLKFKLDSTIYRVIKKEFDDTVIALTQRGKHYKITIPQLEQMILLNEPKPQH